MNISEYGERKLYAISAGANAIKQIAGFMENISASCYTGNANEIEKQLLNVKESVDLLIVGYEQNFGEIKCRKRMTSKPTDTN